MKILMSILLTNTICCLLVAQTTFCNASKVYVVYMGSKSISSSENDEGLRMYQQMLAVVHNGSIELAQASHVYSYEHSFKGFAAKLTEEQALAMKKMPGVVSVFSNRKRKLHTTHSWEFMGLINDEAMEIPGYSTKNQENVIIGFIDTGVWPESPSFIDQSMPPVPSKWKGQCHTGESFNTSFCNRKVIGARYYLSGYEAEEEDSVQKKFRSPRDSNGHGSHTASIAAGRYVPNMNFKGLASGGARGGAPIARIAVYKTCWDSGCYDVDLLAAFDDAIKDGVHILSLSLGPEVPQGDYFNDAISIGSFHAEKKGIPVVSSVGNDGSPASATNLAPWLITVAASSTDREFSSDIVLGDGTNYTGESLVLVETNDAQRIIIDASKANAGYFTPYQSSFCLESSLNSTKINGKIVVCQHTGSSSESKRVKGVVVKEAGGIGMILVDETDKDVAISFAIPSAIVGSRAGDRIRSYINHTRHPTALILPAKTVLGSQPAPRVAAFSSKGPNTLTPEILKPDVTAPGLNILAAWSPANGKMDFNIISGTSMACPHITGIIALIKSVYPSWSPSSIKSAIMTTATILDKSGKQITVDPTGRRGNPFDYGAGFVSPTKILNPGLVYDLNPSDYYNFLCSIGYDTTSLRLITHDNFTCNTRKDSLVPSVSDLNYPSITLPDLKDKYAVTRTVTNVGDPNSIYKAVVEAPKGIVVKVSPNVLKFGNYGQKISFTVTFKVSAPSKGYVFGSLIWKQGTISVRSPLTVRVATSKSGLLR